MSKPTNNEIQSRLANFFTQYKKIVPRTEILDPFHLAEELMDDLKDVGWEIAERKN